jgi:hypothetical protein
MASVAIGKIPRFHIDASQEKRDQRDVKAGKQQIAIDRRQGSRWVADRSHLPANHPDNIHKPHRCHETFARDITDCKDKVALDLQQGYEVTGEMTHGEDLAGKLIRAGAKVTRSAQFSLQLCGFVHSAAQIVVLAR